MGGILLVKHDTIVGMFKDISEAIVEAVKYTKLYYEIDDPMTIQKILGYLSEYCFCGVSYWDIELLKNWLEEEHGFLFYEVK